MREEGYYWVKFNDEWQIAYYCGSEFNGWYRLADEFDYEDQDFNEINEDLIRRYDDKSIK